MLYFILKDKKTQQNPRRVGVITVRLQNFPAELFGIKTTYLECYFLIVSWVTCVQNGSLIDLSKSSLSNQAVHMERAGTFKRLTTLSPAYKLHKRPHYSEKKKKKKRKIKSTSLNNKLLL